VLLGGRGEAHELDGSPRDDDTLVDGVEQVRPFLSDPGQVPRLAMVPSIRRIRRVT
jgi:hypothetical protein